MRLKLSHVTKNTIGHCGKTAFLKILCHPKGSVVLSEAVSEWWLFVGCYLSLFGIKEAVHACPIPFHVSFTYVTLPPVCFAPSLFSLPHPCIPPAILEEDECNEGEDEDHGIVCLSGDVTEGNNIVLCDGAHSDAWGCHQLCCNPPLHEIPDGEWLCPDCIDSASTTSSRVRDPSYAPSHTTTDSSSSTGTGSSPSSRPGSTSDSDSGSNSSSDRDSSSSTCSSDSDIDFE